MSAPRSTLALVLAAVAALAGCAENAPSAPAAPDPGPQASVPCPDADEDDECPEAAGFVPNHAETTTGCTWSTTEGHVYFPLVAGTVLSFVGVDEDGDPSSATMEILDETRVLAGVETRAVDLRIEVEGELEEVERTYVALCRETGSLWLFGEETEEYDDGEVEERDSALAGLADAEPTLLLPGSPEAGLAFLAALTPDETEAVTIVAVGVPVETPAGTYPDGLHVSEGAGDDAEDAWFARAEGPVVVDGLRRAPPPAPEVPTFVESVDNCTFATTGANPFFPVVPGWTLVLEGEDDGDPVSVTMTITDETKVVDGVTTRVLLEEEVEDGELVERSWNYLAVCEETGSVFYFGEDVDIYDDGKLESHDGAWLAGKDGAVAGVLMPGTPAVGMSHFQEQAPGVALDFAEIVGANDTVVTPAGTFTDTLKVRETTSLEPGAVDFKWYARGVGMIVDASLKLASYGDEE